MIDNSGTNSMDMPDNSNDESRAHLQVKESAVDKVKKTEKYCPKYGISSTHGNHLLILDSKSIESFLNYALTYKTIICHRLSLTKFALTHTKEG